MYEVFYNFKAEPFRLSPDHNFCYEHKGYARARAYMAYAFMRAEGFVVITGRPGTGKTTLIGELVENLASDDVSTANLVCTQLGADDLLKTVAYNFGIQAEGADKAELLQRLSVLFHRWHRDGRRALLIVDEAQDLSVAAMEELRLLTNIQEDGQPLLQIFLLGQPELRELVLSPEMEQVHQRIVAASHLEGLEPDEVEAYVLHRLERVGWQGDPAISHAVFPLIHKYSEGVPRRINLICSRLFLHAGVEQRHEIGVAELKTVISELQSENLAAGKRIVQDDFDVGTQSDWARGKTQSQEASRSEVHLRAVNDTATGTPPPAPPGEEGPDDAGKKKAKTEGQRSERGPASARVTAFSGSARQGDQTSAPAQQETEHSSQPGGVRERPLFQSSVTALRAEEEEAGASPSAHDPDRVEAEPFAARQPGRSRPEPARRKTGSNQPLSGNPPTNGKRRGRLVIASLVLAIGLCVVGLLALQLFSPVGEFRALPDSLRDAPGPGRAEAEAISDEPGSGTGNPAAEAVARHDESVPAANSAATEQDTGSFAADVPPALSPVVAVEQVPSSAPEVAETASTGTAPVASLSTPAEQGQTEVTLDQPLLLLVGFAFDSVSLSSDALEVLDEAADLLNSRLSSRAEITGFADQSGDILYNMDLSRDRALAVEEYLVAAGVERQRLRVEGRGVLEAGADGPGRDGDSDTERYRIVQIKIIPDAGF